MRVRDGGLDYIGYHSARRAPQALSSAGEIDQGADSAHICQKNKREREPGRGGWWAMTSVGPALCGQRIRIAQDRQGKWRRRSVAAKGLPVLRGISITTGLCSRRRLGGRLHPCSGHAAPLCSFSDPSYPHPPRRRVSPISVHAHRQPPLSCHPAPL